MLQSIEFKCDFCGEPIIKNGWCKTRMAAGKKTRNTMFEKVWVHDPQMSISGSHICDECVHELCNAVTR